MTCKRGVGQKRKKEAEGQSWDCRSEGREAKSLQVEQQDPSSRSLELLTVQE